MSYSSSYNGFISTRGTIHLAEEVLVCYVVMLSLTHPRIIMNPWRWWEEKSLWINYLAQGWSTNFPATEYLSVSAPHDWHVPRFYVQALKINIVIKEAETWHSEGGGGSKSWCVELMAASGLWWELRSHKSSVKRCKTYFSEVNQEKFPKHFCAPHVARLRR